MSSRLSFWLAAILLGLSPIVTTAQEAPPAGDAPVAAQPEDGPEVVVDKPEAAGEPAANQAGDTQVDLSSPQACMRSFVLAMEDVVGEKPKRIDDALRCVDVSQIDGDDPAAKARLQTRRLYDLIDRIGVKLDAIPAEPNGQNRWVFYETDWPEEADQPADSVLPPRPQPAIEMTWSQKDHFWRFSAHTLASLDAVENALDTTDEAGEAAQKAAEADSKIVAARRTPRATIRGFRAAMEADDPQAAATFLDPASIDSKVWEAKGQQSAITLWDLLRIINGPVLTEIPDTPDGGDYTWYAGKNGSIILSRVTGDVDYAGEWRFSPDTLKSLDALYAEYRDQADQLGRKPSFSLLRFGVWLKYHHPVFLDFSFIYLEGWQWLSVLILLAVGWGLKFVSSIVIAIVARVGFSRIKLSLDREGLHRASRACGSAAVVIFWYYTYKYLPLDNAEGLQRALLAIFGFGVPFALLWASYRLVDIVGTQVTARKDLRLTAFDELLFPMMKTIIRLLVVVIVILFVMDYWMDQPPTAVIGALGIGGVALAFAAKDTLGNFFGSVTVLLDRPFGIGDWIVVGDVEGTVERVGFRSTRVRTFYNSLITVPNSMMVSAQVDNYGARQYRRLSFRLDITYDTPADKVDAFCEGIRELVRLHPYTRKDYYHVYFNSFGESALKILLYTFFEVPDWSTELRERHRLLLDILRLAQHLGVEFAFPTQTIHLAKEPAEAAQKAALAREEAETHGMKQAAKLFQKEYGVVPDHPGPVVIETLPRSRSVDLHKD